MSRSDVRLLLEARAAWYIMPDQVLSEIRTLPGVGVMHAWRVLRLLAVSAVDGGPRETWPFDRCGMEAFEEAILHAEYEDSIRLPLAVLVRCLTPGAEPDMERLARACLCAADWAFTIGGAPGVARSFAYAGARISGLWRCTWK
jgi:hypothetical protein